MHRCPSIQYTKAFDSLDDCFNDLHDILPQDKCDEKISLMYKSNLNNLVAVRTPAGLSNRINLRSINQQGGIWGSILCSNTMDSIGRKCRDKGKHIYLYKNRTSILPLGFVDDLNGIAKCGSESHELNLYLNTQVELKKLRFHCDKNGTSSKCVKMHVGKARSSCPNLKVHDNLINNVSEISYLGDTITADGKNVKNMD